MSKSIILIGFMGVGKTTIGEELARKLQIGFIDIDAEIEAKYGMETVDIFNTHGEEAFRKTEEDITISSSKLENKVISVGGGAFLNERIRDACMNNGIVIFLDMSWEEWKNRLSILVSTRPILQGKSLNQIKELFEERQAIYKEHHLRVLIDQIGVNLAVERICDELDVFN